MLTRFKIAIFLFCVFTMVMTAPYKPAKRSVQDLGVATRDLWQSVADKVAVALPNVTVHAQNISSHDKNVSAICLNMRWLQKLCDTWRRFTGVSEPEKSNQTGTIGTWFAKTIKQVINNKEWHIPGYKYCGPNTKAELKLSRGEKGINLLDEACKEHDIGYMENPTYERKIDMDRTLVLQAHERKKAANATRKEKIAAKIVVTFMCVKLEYTTKCKGVSGRKKQQKQKPLIILRM